MTERKFSKYQDTMYNHFVAVRRATYSVYRSVENGKMAFDKYLEIKRSRIFDHPSYKILTSSYQAHISGISEALFDMIYRHMEWRHYYTNKVGKVKFEKDWSKLPLYIKKSGNFKSGHFWRGTDKPWGELSNGHPAPGLKCNRKNKEK